MADRIERELLLPAPPGDVWEVVTRSGWLAEQVKIDPVPGGEAAFVDRDGRRTGWVEEARAPERLVFWWGAEGEPDSRVELTLTPEGPSTRVRVVETRPLELLDLTGIPLPGPGGIRYGPALLAAA